MSITAIFLPGILLAFAFIVKLVVDREVDIPNTIYSLLELPVDVLFLATSFIAAYTISKQLEYGMLYYTAYLVAALLVVLFWKKTIRLFEAGKIKTTIFLSLLNYSICTTCLVRAIQLV